MINPQAYAARAVAAVLAPEYGLDLPVDVEVALAARNLDDRPDRYLDSISLATLIVTITQLAWTIYADKHDHEAQHPDAETLTHEVRITMRERNIQLPDGTEHITEIIAREIKRLADPPE